MENYSLEISNVLYLGAEKRRSKNCHVFQILNNRQGCGTYSFYGHVLGMRNVPGAVGNLLISGSVAKFEEEDEISG